MMKRGVEITEFRMYFIDLLNSLDNDYWMSRLEKRGNAECPAFRVWSMLSEVNKYGVNISSNEKRVLP